MSNWLYWSGLLILTWHVQGHTNVDLIKEVEIKFSDVRDSSQPLSLDYHLVTQQNLLTTPA